MATGRAKPAFETVVDGIPMNASHRAVQRRGYLRLLRRRSTWSRPFCRTPSGQHVTEVVTALPQVAVELYHDDNTIHALNANDVTRRHMHITHAPSIEVDTMDDGAVPHQQGAVLHGGGST